MNSLRLIAALILAGFALTTAHPALATSKENIERMNKQFDSMGRVVYVAYTDLGSPEIGVAELAGGPVKEHAKPAKNQPAEAPAAEDPAPGNHRLVILKADDKGNISTLSTEPFTSTGNRHDFTFINGGKHLLTYAAQDWTDEHGVSHTRGDLVIRDLTAAGGPKQIYILKGAEDLGFKVAGSPKFQDNLIWQPMLHFLNTGERLPRRFAYSRLLWDDQKQEYTLAHFLTPLPQADTVVAANLNNRAIMYYRAGYLADAAQTFSQATTQAMSDQGIIAHNTELVGVEMEDISRQGAKLKDQPFDEALSEYWRGEFDDSIATLARRGDSLKEYDYALLGLALAQARRWPEVDRTTQSLATVALSPGGRGKQFYADYLGEMVRIALLQGPRMTETAGRYLKALENLDKGHPAYIAGIAALMQRNGQTSETERMVRSYIDISPGDLDLADLRLMLFELYQSTGQPTNALIADAQREPVRNIAGIVDLLDYYDLRPALKKLSYEGDMFEIKGRLSNFGLTDQRPGGEGAAPVDESDIVESGTVIKGESH
jgi:hypothetical protein